MRGLKKICFIFLIVIGAFYFLQGQLKQQDTISYMEDVISREKINIESKVSPEQNNPFLGIQGELFSWIGKSVEELEAALGQPDRRDTSTYGYNWWVYKNNNQYIQIGVKNEKIVTIYAIGDSLSLEPIEIGKSYQKLNEIFSFNDEVSFTDGVTSYRFKLNETDVKMRPLARISPKIFAQFYFDTFTEKLSSIRLLTKETLLMQRPYEIFYRGDLPTSPILSQEELQKAEDGMEQQIFDITNVIRARYNKTKLEWDDTVANVAFNHSKDMAENNYFSHYTLEGDGLKERLGEHNIVYFSAGENIAAQYTDASAAVEGWLNSKGHREALLKPEYTHLGVGVFNYYYTQNFLEKPTIRDEQSD